MFWLAWQLLGVANRRYRHPRRMADRWGDNRVALGETVRRLPILAGRGHRGSVYRDVVAVLEALGRAENGW